MDTDIRIKNAKVRLQERAKRKAEEEEEKTVKKSDREEGDLKKRRLDEIEDTAMREEDPVKLSELFEEYRLEYLKDRGSEDEGAKKEESGDGGADPGEVLGVGRGCQVRRNGSEQGNRRPG